MVLTFDDGLTECHQNHCSPVKEKGGARSFLSEQSFH